MAQNRIMISLALAACAAASAYASPQRPASPQDIYPATESETSIPSAVVAPAPVAAQAPRPRQAAGIAQLKQAPPPVRAIAPVANGKLPDSALAYDLVPSDQIDPLAKRLQLVEILMRKYARAYDYRTHTLHELNLILAKLDSTGAPATQKIAKASPSQPPIPSESDEMGVMENTHAE